MLRRPPWARYVPRHLRVTAPQDNFKIGVFTGFGSPMCHMQREELKSLTIFDVCLPNGGGATGEGVPQAELLAIIERNNGTSPRATPSQ